MYKLPINNRSSTNSVNEKNQSLNVIWNQKCLHYNNKLYLQKEGFVNGSS